MLTKKGDEVRLVLIKFSCYATEQKHDKIKISKGGGKVGQGEINGGKGGTCNTIINKGLNIYMYIQTNKN